MSHELTSTFRRQLRKIGRKHRNAAARVNKVLNDIGANGLPAGAHRIPGLGGAPVFKLRIAIGGKGTRAARLIFFYDSERLIPLFIYTKADLKGHALSDISGALDAAGLTDRHRTAGAS